jgi:iron complex outermembrane receptor protein
MSGPLFELPAGTVRATVRTGFATQRLDSFADRAGRVSQANLGRDEGNGRINIDIPLTSRDRDIGAAIGNLTL